MWYICYIYVLSIGCVVIRLKWNKINKELLNNYEISRISLFILYQNRKNNHVYNKQAKKRH